MRHALGVILLLVVGSTQAAPVTWTLNDFVYDDGWLGVGTFVYDADTNSFSDISISTRAPNDPSMVNSYPSTWSETVNGAGGFALLGYDVDSNPMVLFMGLDGEMTNSGGQLFVDLSLEFYCGTPCNLTFPGPPERTLVSGNISAVPIPAAVYLFGSGLGLLGWFRRKKA